jgi:hypothetical protein
MSFKGRETVLNNSIISVTSKPYEKELRELPCIQRLYTTNRFLFPTDHYERILDTHFQKRQRTI